MRTNYTYRDEDQGLTVEYTVLFNVQGGLAGTATEPGEGRAVVDLEYEVQVITFEGDFPELRVSEYRLSVPVCDRWNAWFLRLVEASAVLRESVESACLASQEG